MGLAAPAGPGEWMVGLEAERSLRDLGMRGDIIKTMHRAFTEKGLERGIADYVIDTGAAPSPIIGRLVDKGLHDELTGEAYVVIDGTDGRAHHVRFRGIDVFEHSPPTGGIVEVRRFGGPDDQRPTLVLANRSDFDLARSSNGVGRNLARSSPGRARADAAFHGWVRTRGPRRDDGSGRPSRGRRARRSAGPTDHSSPRPPRHAAAARAGCGRSQTIGRDRTAPLVGTAGEHVTGTYRQRLTLTSGRFAMIEQRFGLPARAVVTNVGEAAWSTCRRRHEGRGRHRLGTRASENPQPVEFFCDVACPLSPSQCNSTG